MLGDRGKRYLLADDVAAAFCVLLANIIAHSFTEDAYSHLHVDAFNSCIVIHITKLCDDEIRATPGWLPPTKPHYHWYSIYDIAYRVDGLVRKKYN